MHSTDTRKYFGPQAMPLHVGRNSAALPSPNSAKLDAIAIAASALTKSINGWIMEVAARKCVQALQLMIMAGYSELL